MEGKSATNTLNKEPRIESWDISEEIFDIRKKLGEEL